MYKTNQNNLLSPVLTGFDRYWQVVSWDQHRSTHCFPEESWGRPWGCSWRRSHWENLRDATEIRRRSMDPMDPVAGLGVFMLCNAKCPGGIKGAGILGTARPCTMHVLYWFLYCTCSLGGGTLSALNPLTLLSKKEQVTSAAHYPIFAGRSTIVYLDLSSFIHLKIPGFGYTL